MRGAFALSWTNRPELVHWRQGRCLPYGDGIAFWALGEMVKAQAGILESDDPEQASVKLERGPVPAGEERTEVEWLRAGLRPLVGSRGEPVARRSRWPPGGSS